MLLDALVHRRLVDELGSFLVEEDILRLLLYRDALKLLLRLHERVVHFGVDQVVLLAHWV